MKTIPVILKNNYLRTLNRIGTVILMIVFIIISMSLAIYITNIQEVKGHVAFIANDPNQEIPESSKHLKISLVSEKPPLSELMKQKYNAFAYFDKNNELEIETLYSEDYQNLMLLLLQNPDAYTTNKEERGAGVNIIGFSMMFMLMFMVRNLELFADEKEQGQLLRIASTPASLFGYILAQNIYCFSMLIPLFIPIIVLKSLGYDIGFTIAQYTGLILLVGFLGFSLALLLYSLIDKADDANMLGSAIIVFTTVLAGGFYSFSKENIFIDTIISLLPQKRIMIVAQGLEKGNFQASLTSLLYVLVFSLLLYSLSYKTLAKTVKEG